MRMKIALGVAMTVALLAGCNRAATTNNAASANKAAPANAVVPAPAPATNAAAPAAPTGTPATAANLIGRWGMTAACEMTLEFNDEGQIIQTAGDQTETVAYSLGADGALTITREGRPPETGRAAMNGPNLVLTDPTGSPTTFVPCAE